MDSLSIGSNDMADDAVRGKLGFMTSSTAIAWRRMPTIAAARTAPTLKGKPDIHFQLSMPYLI
jgi:hypothetical protein